MLRIRSLFYRIRILIRDSGLEKKDPHLIIVFYLGKKLVQQCLTWFRHFVTLEVKDQRIIYPKLYVREFSKEKLNKYDDIFCRLRIRISFLFPDPGDSKRPDPQHCFSPFLYTYFSIKKSACLETMERPLKYFYFKIYTEVKLQ